MRLATRQDRWYSLFGQMRQLLIAALCGVTVCCATFGAQTLIAQDEPAPVTDDEYEAFVTAIDEAIADNNVSEFNELVDWDVIIQQATELKTESTPAVEKARQQFADNFKKGLGETGPCRQIMEICQNGGTYRLLSYPTVGKQRRVLFRLLQSGGEGVNYHFWTLSRRKNGEVRATGLYMLLLGESLSQTLRMFYLPAVYVDTKGAAVPEADKPFCESVDRLRKINELVLANKFAEVLKGYDALPDAVKKVRSVQTMRLRAASEVSDKQYAAAIDDFRALYPKDPSVDFVLIDGYVLRKQFDKAIACVDATEKLVGNDPYLNIVRGNVYLQAGALDKARAAAKAAIDVDKSMMDAFWLRVNISLRDKSHDETLAALKAIDQGFEIDEFDDLTSLAEYVDFVASPQFKEWKKYQDGKAKQRTADKNAKDAAAKAATAPAGKSAPRKK